MAKSKFNICLIGAGRMGGRWAQTIAENSRLRLRLVIDKDNRAGQELAKTHKSIFVQNINETTLAKNDIDVVFVVTPHKFLYQYARLGLASGRHVIVEKPGARSSVEMKRLVRLAGEHKRKLIVGFSYRYFDVIAKAKKIVDSGKIGKVLFIRLAHGHDGRAGYSREWRMNKDIAGGGVLMDQGVHLFDLANWFLPSPIVDIKSELSNSYLRTEVEDNAFVILKNRAGQIISLSVSVNEWQPIFVMEIFGDKGFVRVDGVGRKYGGGERLTLGQVSGNNKVRLKTIECNPDYGAMLKRELSDFVKVLDGKGRDYPGGEDAVKVLEVVRRAYLKQ